MFISPHALKPLLFLFQLLRPLASPTKNENKERFRVKTKRLNAITVKLDTHETFAGVSLTVLEVFAKYRFVLRKIWEKTFETNSAIFPLDVE